MADTQNRFEERKARVPLRIPVELGEGGFADPFEARAVNLSKGGLSMRSACLPDPGTRLACRFRALPSNTLVTAQGEVVWAHLDDAQSGEFGLAFVDLDPKTEWLIEEMLAEQARIEGPRPDGEVAASVAQLELEGSGGAIAARVARADGKTVVFEQRLDVLSVGRGVRAQADGGQGRKGNIAGVELRMVGSVPMLAVTVAFDETASSLGMTPSPEPEHDTARDLQAPPQVQEAPPRDPRSTLLEFEAWRASRAQELGAEEEQASASAHADPAAPEVTVDAKEPIEGDVETDESWQAALREAARASQPPPAEPARATEGEEPGIHDQATANPALHAPEPVIAVAAVPEPRIVPSGTWIDAKRVDPLAPPVAPAQAAPTPPGRERPRVEREALPAREPSVSFRTQSIDPEDEAELAAMFEPEPSSLQRIATRVLLALRVHGGAALRAAGPLALAAYEKGAPWLRMLLLRMAAVGRSLLALVGPQLGATRRVVARAFVQPRRRKTTAPAQVVVAEERSGLLRTVLLSVMGAAAVAMAVYAFAPVGGDDEATLSRAVKHRKHRRPAAEAAQTAQTAQPAADPMAAASGEPAVAPDPQLVPSAASVPASSPFAVDVRGGAKPAAPAAQANVAARAAATAVPPSVTGKTLRFGAASVPGGRRFSLRMSARIASLQGAADAGGFTVVAMGGLALDRAGPIKSALPVVARSMIINRGDRAELTIRFVDGKRPAYQVTASGSTLDVVIQDL